MAVDNRKTKLRSAAQLDRVYIANVGMITAVGANAPTTAIAVMAGINTVAESSIFNHAFKAMKLAPIPDGALPELLPELSKSGFPQQQARMIRSFSVALAQCLDGRVVTPLPLFLALPEAIPGLPQANFSGFLKKVATQTGIPIDLASSRALHLGRAGGMHALHLAFNYLDQTGNDFVLVGGVDSPFNHSWLAYMDYHKRISSQGASDTFAPGEAACCLLIASEEGRRKLGLQKACWFSEPVLSKEPGHIYSDQPYRGDGLADVFRKALTPGTDAINHAFTTLNGESFSAKELGVAMSRNSAKMAPGIVIHHPADCFGDIGAAFSAVLVGMAAFNLASSRLQGRCLVYGSSETEYRGAVVLQI